MSISRDNHPRLLEGDAAIEYYNNNLLQKTPTKIFTLQAIVPTIFVCIFIGSTVGILLSIWFLMIGPVAFISAHIIVNFVLIYTGVYTHNVQWYEETNQYVFILKYIISRKKEITIYNRLESDYISLYKTVSSSSGPYSSINKFYSFRDENQNDVMELFSTKYDYQITEFSEIFGFEFKDESRK